MISWDLISNFCSVSFDVKGFYCAEQIKSPPPLSLGGLVLLRAAVRQTAPPFTLRPSHPLINTVSDL